MTTKQTNANDSTDILSSFEHAQATLSVARDEAARLIAELESKIQLARGTGDVAAQAAAAVAAAAAPAPVPTLPAQLEAILRTRPMSVEDLARATGASTTRVLASLKPLRRRLHNSGTDDRPRWSLVIGDDAPVADLYALVEGLMRDRPHGNAELVTATGARSNRVAGAINEMRRTRAVINAGDGARARWFIVPDGAKLATLVRTRRPTRG